VGPTTLAYLDEADFRPAAGSAFDSVEQVPADDPALRAFDASVPREETAGGTDPRGRLPADIVETRDLRGARALEARDDMVDQLNHRLYDAVLRPGGKRPVGTAIDVALPGRYYERFADHAVSVARRLEFTVTGEFVDAGAA
jgi:hypothetical protein